MLKIAVIILHYGDPQITFGCLKSLALVNKKNIKADTFVLDNQGNMIQKKIPNWDYVLFPFTQNYGFAQGNNEVIKRIKKNKYDYYLFLNNDTKVYPEFLLHLIKVAEKNPNIGICGPVIEHKVGNKTFFDYGGYIDWPKGQPRHFNQNKWDQNDHQQLRDFISGCCLLIKSSVFAQIKGFDKAYFLYLEDVDLNRKVAELGFEIRIIPSAKIYHLGSQSASEWTKIRYSWRNSFRFIKSHVPAKYKLQAYFYNLFFYPALFGKWQLKRLVKNSQLLKYLFLSPKPDKKS